MKELNGKALELFEEWLSKNKKQYSYDDYYNCIKVDVGLAFYHLSQSEQWGVMQDFADSKNIVMEIYTNASGYGYLFTKLNGTTIYEIENDEFYETRNEARLACIRSLNEILNQ